MYVKTIFTVGLDSTRLSKLLIHNIICVDFWFVQALSFFLWSWFRITLIWCFTLNRSFTYFFNTIIRDCLCIILGK